MAIRDSIEVFIADRVVVDWLSANFLAFSFVSRIHLIIQIVIQMVRALPHASTTEQCGEHDPLIESHCADLCLEFEQRLLLSSQLP